MERGARSKPRARRRGVELDLERTVIGALIGDLASDEPGVPAVTGQLLDIVDTREREAITSGMTARPILPDYESKTAPKGTEARWTLKIGGKVRYREDGKPLPIIALPVLGYKSHVNIDRRFCFIRGMTVTSAPAMDGRPLRQIVDTDNTNSDV